MEYKNISELGIPRKTPYAKRDPNYKK